MPALHVAGERQMLEQMLDWYRNGVIAKVRGVSQSAATARPLRSSTSIAGLVKHLALVEDSWWAQDFAGEAVAPWYREVDWDADPDWEFHSAVDEPIEDNLARYTDAIDRCRQIATGRGLDEIGADSSRRQFTLRFVYLHLIEETAPPPRPPRPAPRTVDGTTGE